MKKIFTLLFCTALISSAFAQDGRHDWNDRDRGYHDRDEYNRRHDYDHDRDRGRFHISFFVYQNNRYRYDERDQLIARISSNYDYQIQQVINDWSLSPREKRCEVGNLQIQKAQEINNIYAQCGANAVYPGQDRYYDHHDY
jgi:hypothetical protein